MDDLVRLYQAAVVGLDNAEQWQTMPHTTGILQQSTPPPKLTSEVDVNEVTEAMSYVLGMLQPPLETTLLPPLQVMCLPIAKSLFELLQQTNTQDPSAQAEFTRYMAGKTFKRFSA